MRYKVISSLESRYLRHDSDPFGVDGAEHSVLEEDGEVCLSCLLEGEDGSSLEPGEEALTGEVLSMCGWRSRHRTLSLACCCQPR